MARKRTQKIYETRYVVEGSGDFPIDMMRYDCAYPERESDARAVLRHEPRRIGLVQRSVHSNGPNIARWRSFTWRVVEVEGAAV